MGWLDGIMLQKEDLNLLEILGFYCRKDYDNCSWEPQFGIGVDGQTDENTKNPEDYQKAFKALARLDGDENNLSVFDVRMLGDRKALADVIMKDPMIPGILYKGNALEYGKRESAGKIPPRHFRRFISYVQMGLNVVLADEIKAGSIDALKVNGKYDADTYRAIRLFQKKTDMPCTDDRQFGGILGRWTIYMLALRLAYTKKDLIAALRDDQKKLGRDYFVMGHYHGDDSGPEWDAQVHVFDALRWLGYIGPTSQVDMISDRDAAAVAIEEKFNEGTGPGPQYVGPIVIGRIIKALEESE